MRALGVVIETKEGQNVPWLVGGKCVYAEINVENYPEEICLNIRANGGEIAPLVVFGGRVHEVRDDSNTIGFKLHVPIPWEGTMPKTRQPGIDNLDIIFLDQELKIRDIQVGLISRNGRFFATAQEVFQGWARKDDDGEIQFIPSCHEHAYPGMSYQQAWPAMGKELSIFCRIINDVAEALNAAPPEHEPVEWDPPEIPDLDKWQKGVVLFFNAITGTGMIIGEDGKKYFVHFNNIVNGDSPVKMLAPMTGVYFRVDVSSGKIRSCKSA